MVLLVVAAAVLMRHRTKAAMVVRAKNGIPLMGLVPAAVVVQIQLPFSTTVTAAPAVYMAAAAVLVALVVDLLLGLAAPVLKASSLSLIRLHLRTPILQAFPPQRRPERLVSQLIMMLRFLAFPPQQRLVRSEQHLVRTSIYPAFRLQQQPALLE